jgi:UDP-glucose 4-epimerase
MTAMPKVVAVTGGSGQLGTLLLRRLAAHPQVERILSIDLADPLVTSPKLRSIIADIRDENLARHFVGCDAVVHCAFVVTRGASVDQFRSINIAGSANVFATAATAGVATIVYVSSILAYGCLPDHPVPIRETTTRIDQTDFAYASCKFRVEALLDDFETVHPQIAISRIRANILVGRHMRHLLGKLLHIRWLPDIGGTPLPIVWDEDVADLVVLALQQRARGAFNAAAGELLNASELAQVTDFKPVIGRWPIVTTYHYLHAALGLVGLHLPDPAWYEKTKGAMLVATSERAKTELGWRPLCSTSKAVLERFCAIVPLGLDLRVQIFLCVASHLFGCALLADRLEQGAAPLRINLCLDGRTGRDLTLQRRAGRLAVKAGPQTNPTSTVELDDLLFRKILLGATALEAARRSGAIFFEGDDGDWETFTALVAKIAEYRKGSGWRSRILRGMARLTAWPRSIDEINCRTKG